MDNISINNELFELVKGKSPGAIEQLLTANSAYIITMSKDIYKRYHTKCDFDDVLQTLYANLFEVVRDYASKGADWQQKYLTIAVNKTKHDVYDQYKNTGDYAYSTMLQGRENKVAISIERLLEAADGVDEAHEKILYKDLTSVSVDAAEIDNCDALYLDDTLNHLSSLVNSLDDEKKFIVMSYFVNKMTKKEIAEQLGISAMTVARYLSSTLEQLRDELLSYDNQAQTCVALLH